MASTETYMQLIKDWYEANGKTFPGPQPRKVRSELAKFQLIDELAAWAEGHGTSAN